MALIDIVQDACSRLALKQPAAVVGSTDLTAQIMLSLANQSGKELARFHDWQNITVLQTFTSLGQEEQTNAFPSDDYDRMVFNPEVWNRSKHLRYVGPTPQRVWQQLMSGIAAGVVGWWRILGNQLHIYPAPDAGQIIAFEYVSKNWCESASGDPQSKFQADTDVAKVSEDLLTLELVWRFKQARGFAYAEDLSTCEREKEKMAARDRGTGRIRPENVDITNWPPQPIWTGNITN